jgi:hypothetical protein
MKEQKPIGPMPVVSEHPYNENTLDPFVVDKNNQHQQALAKRIGWDRLHQIAKLDTQETDLQRSPFNKGGAEPEVNPRRPTRKE